MENYKERLADDFNQYQLLTTDVQRAAFWSAIENQVNSLPNSHREAFQEAVRYNIDQMISRMQIISQRLSVTEAV